MNFFVEIIILLYLIVAAKIDYKKHIIPNWLNLVFFIFRFVFIPIFALTMNHIYGLVFAVLMFGLPALVLKQDIGGDIKMAAVLGLWLGLQNVIAVLTLAALTALVYMLVKKLKGIPFAPATLVAYMLWLTTNTIFS